MPATRPLERLTNAYSARKRHYTRKRAFAQAFADKGYPEIAQQLRDCQETEVLACCSNCGKSWYIVNKCRMRVCPLCSYEISQKRATYLIELAQKMTYPKMITLTMPRWEDDPREGIQYLRKAWNVLRRHKLFKKVTGGAYQIELKPKEGGWHIHLHALIEAPYLPYQRLFSVWKAILAIDAPQVDIRAAGAPNQIRYVCKYAAKAADFHSDPSSVVDWYEATKGLRLFATFGTWYNSTLETLLGTDQFQETAAKCPHCKAEGKSFLARDGPFHYAKGDWAKHFKTAIHGLELTKPIDAIRGPTTEAYELYRRKRTRTATATAKETAA